MSQSMYPYSPLSNQSKYVPCFQQDGKIYTWDQEGTRQIGVTTKTHEVIQKEYEEALIRLQEYYEHLTKKQICPHCEGSVPAIITPEPSAQDIIQQQNDQLRQAQEALVVSQKTQQQLINGNMALMEKVEELTQAVAAITGGSNEISIDTQSTSNSGQGSVSVNKKSSAKS